MSLRQFLKWAPHFGGSRLWVGSMMRHQVIGIAMQQAPAPVHSSDGQRTRDRHEFLFVLVGSAGDVLPGLTLASQLVRMGHRATVLSNDYFREKVEKSGVSFLSNGPLEEYFRLTKHPDLWKPLKGTKLLLADPQFTKMQGMQFEAVREWVEQRSGKSIAVIGSSLALGARIAREIQPFPMASLHLSPAVFRSVVEPPRLSTTGMMSWLHHRYPKAFRYLVDRFLIDPLLESQLGGLRRQLGIAPIRGWFGQWLHSPDLVIALFPEWFSQPGDLPPQTRQYPFLLCGNEEPLPVEIAQFLERGSAPIVVTLGSAMAQATRAFEAVGRVAQKLKRRVVYLTQHPEQLGPVVQKMSEGDHGLVAKWAPLGPLFERSALVIHHGGIGTLAQVLQSGVPQLILPFAHDQPDNAERIKRKGLGDFHNAHWLWQGKLRNQMAELLESQKLRENCQLTAARMRREAAPGKIEADLVSLATGKFGKSAVPT